MNRLAGLISCAATLFYVSRALPARALYRAGEPSALCLPTCFRVLTVSLYHGGGGLKIYLLDAIQPQ